MLAPARVLGMDKREAEARALQLLKRIGLDLKAPSYPDQLSGGQM